MEDHGRCIERDGSLEVLTNAHLASLACEADESAAKLGRVTLKDMASAFNLPIEVTWLVVTVRWGGASATMQRLAVSTIPAKACQAGLRHVSNPIRYAAYCLHLRKQVTEALLAGWMLGDDRAPRLLSLSRSRLVGGAVVTEAYESAKLTAVRPQFFLVVETIFNLQPTTTPLSLTSVL